MTRIPPPRPAPPPPWALKRGGDTEPPRFRARIGRLLRRWLTIADEHDAWLDRRAAERLRNNPLRPTNWPKPGPPNQGSGRKPPPPTDEVSLCRLAELGRDLKTWRKIAAEAMHGWLLCNDGRLYHAVVAEGVNAAWQSKSAQRDRTEAARVARAAKRLSQTPETSVTEPEGSAKSSVTISVTDTVTASNRTEHNRTDKGSKEDSEADASGAEAPDPDPVKELWERGVRILGASSRSLIGKARKQYGDLAVIRAIAACEIEAPTDPVSFFAKCLQQGLSNERKQQSGYDTLARAAIEHDERQGHCGSSEAPYRSTRDAEELDDGGSVVHRSFGRHPA